MSDAIQNFLNFLNPGSSMADLAYACRRLVDESDLVHCSAAKFTEPEREAIAEGILHFILNPDDDGGDRGWREIVFDSQHALVGRAIEHYEFASWFSSEFLSSYCKATWDRPITDPAARLARVQEYYAAMLFRYSWCVRADTAAFPVSEILEFAEQCEVMQRLRGREASPGMTVHLVLLALRACERSPRWGN
jgi:hypothetical protein